MFIGLTHQYQRIYFVVISHNNSVKTFNIKKKHISYINEIGLNSFSIILLLICYCIKWHNIIIWTYNVWKINIFEDTLLHMNIMNKAWSYYWIQIYRYWKDTILKRSAEEINIGSDKRKIILKIIVTGVYLFQFGQAYFHLRAYF